MRKHARARSAVNPMLAPPSSVKLSNGVGDKPIALTSPERNDHAPNPSALANQTNKMEKLPIFEES